MKKISEYLGALSLLSAVFGGLGYVYDAYGVAWAVGSLFLIWMIGPFIPLFAGIKDGYWVLAVWVYVPAVLALIAAMLAHRSKG